MAILRKSTSKKQSVKTVRKSTAVLAPVKNHVDYSAYDEPVRKSSVIKTNCRQSLILQNRDNYRAMLHHGNSERFSHVIAQGPICYEEDISPFHTNISNIKKHAEASSMNFIDTDNFTVYQKRRVHTYQNIPAEHELTQRKEIRRQVKYV
jgi:hypothetical protein